KKHRPSEDMSESNLSKSDLEELCRAFGVSTNGVKADLVQSLKQFSTEASKNLDNVEGTGETGVGTFDIDESENHMYGDDLDIDPEARLLKKLAYRSKGKSKHLTSNNDLEDPNTSQAHVEECLNQNKRQYSKMNLDNPLGNLVLSEFKKLENVMTNFNNRLNSVTMQVQDTRYRAEINEAWSTCKFEKPRDQHEYDSLCTIGTELDLAMESRNFSDIISHIEKAWESVANQNRDFTFRKPNSQDKPQHFYQNSYQNSYQTPYPNHRGVGLWTLRKRLPLRSIPQHPTPARTHL
ncbi:8317_t:CDS:2, partial [Dentiscutata erythropus]